MHAGVFFTLPCLHLHVCDLVCLASKLSLWSHRTKLTEEEERELWGEMRARQKCWAEERRNRGAGDELGKRRRRRSWGSVELSGAAGRRRGEQMKQRKGRITGTETKAGGWHGDFQKVTQRELFDSLRISWHESSTLQFFKLHSQSELNVYKMATYGETGSKQSSPHQLALVGFLNKTERADKWC